MLHIRLLSALVLIPPVLAAAWFGGLFFTLLVAAVTVLMAWEWERLCGDTAGLSAGIVGAVGAVSAVVAASQPLWALAALALAAALVAVERRRRDLPRPLWVAAGALYVGVPVAALVWLRADAALGREALLWLLALVWATDTGAYVAGRTIGGPRLAPRISPKKTWAGLLGGMAAAAAVGAAFAAAGSGLGGAAALAGLSAALAVVAQAGDLAESAVKRHFGIKDSGAIIPGHGGLFDRLDGLLAAAPVVAVVMALGAFPVGR